MVGPVEPYLKLGVICEHALQEKDNVLSIIRIVDRFTITISGEEPPDEMPEGVNIMTIVMCWTGGLGTHEASFRIQSPSGDIQPSPQTWSFNLDALNRSHNIIVKIPVRIKRPGIYWIQYLLNDEVKSRIPFQVIYQKQKISK
jgi:hypothetical protein